MARIINKNHFSRLQKLLSQTKGKIVQGGKDLDADELFIEPTVVIDVDENDSLMKDEIFGPILPVMPYKTLEDVRQTMNRVEEHPLAAYIMSEDQAEIDWVLHNIRSGDCSVNGESPLLPGGSQSNIMLQRRDGAYCCSYAIWWSRSKRYW